MIGLPARGHQRIDIEKDQVVGKPEPPVAASFDLGQRSPEPPGVPAEHGRYLGAVELSIMT